METTGSWILMSQPSPLPRRHSWENHFSLLNYFDAFSMFYLINHRKCGAICAIPLDYYYKAPQHRGYYYLMCLKRHFWSMRSYLCAILKLELIKTDESELKFQQKGFELRDIWKAPVTLVFLAAQVWTGADLNGGQKLLTARQMSSQSSLILKSCTGNREFAPPIIRP